jgi:O-antigen/teichoic acid export membrane protein
MSSISKRIAKNTFFNFITQTVGLASALVLSIIVARLLGPNRFGSYTLITFTFTVAALLANLGLFNVGIKYIAEFSGEDNKKIRCGILSHILRIELIATAIVAAVLILLARNLAVFYSDNKLFIYIVVSAIGLFPAGLAAIMSGGIKGLQKYKYLAYRTLILSPVRLGLSFVLLKLGHGIIALILVNAFVSALNFIFYFALIKKELGFKLGASYSLPSDIRRRIFRYNWQVALIMFIDAIVWRRSEVFFLGRFHPSSEVGFYGLAYSIVEQAMIFLPGIFAGVLLPVISELYGKKDKTSLQKIFIYSSRYLSFATIPACVGLIMLSKSIIFSFYGPGYLKAASVLRILSISGCFGIIAGAASSIQYGTERQDFILKWGSVTAVINIILDFVLIPNFGAIGAAIANSATQICAVVVGILVVCRSLSVAFPVFDTAKALFSALCMIPAIMVITSYDNGPIGILLSLSSGLLIYIIMILATRALDANDYKMISSLTNRLPVFFRSRSKKILVLISGYVR